MSDGIEGATRITDALEQTIVSGDVGFSVAETPQEYIRFVYQYDRPEWARIAMKSQSVCMVVCMRALDHAGVTEKGFREPYEKYSGRIQELMQNAGNKWKSWVNLTNVGDFEVKFGQQFWIGMDGPDGKPLQGWGGHSHMFTVTDQREAEMTSGEKFDLYVTIEGGKIYKGGYAILRCYRRLVKMGGHLWFQELREKDGAYYVVDQGRRCYGVMDPYRGMLKDLLAAAAAGS